MNINIDAIITGLLVIATVLYIKSGIRGQLSRIEDLIIERKKLYHGWKLPPPPPRKQTDDIALGKMSLYRVDHGVITSNGDSIDSYCIAQSLKQVLSEYPNLKKITLIKENIEVIKK